MFGDTVWSFKVYVWWYEHKIVKITGESWIPMQIVDHMVSWLEMGLTSNSTFVENWKFRIWGGISMKNFLVWKFLYGQNLQKWGGIKIFTIMFRHFWKSWPLQQHSGSFRLQISGKRIELRFIWISGIIGSSDYSVLLEHECLCLSLIVKSSNVYRLDSI